MSDVDTLVLSNQLRRLRYEAQEIEMCIHVVKCNYERDLSKLDRRRAVLRPEIDRIYTALYWQRLIELCLTPCRRYRVVE